MAGADPARAGRPDPLGPEQAVTATEALALFTTGAAAVAGLPDAGRLHVGGPADLALLDVDPLGDPDALAEGRVRATVARGEVYEH
ncbi:hypothetical protein BJF78_00870 [Pseudonocardia sp. CNS-139]|nr:hypothetical protein BJF78_00870 [Pseudonocardia sp. CNS-139]